jgi:hypothetical protein
LEGGKVKKVKKVISHQLIGYRRKSLTTGHRGYKEIQKFRNSEISRSSRITKLKAGPRKAVEKLNRNSKLEIQNY